MARQGVQRGCQGDIYRTHTGGIHTMLDSTDKEGRGLDLRCRLRTSLPCDVGDQRVTLESNASYLSGTERHRRHAIKKKEIQMKWPQKGEVGGRWRNIMNSCLLTNVEEVLT